MTEAIRTTCPYCGVGCGILAARDGRGGLDVRGDPDHPANRGRLCSKGSALGETVGLERRLLHPVIDGQRAGWDRALDLVAGRFAETIDKHGPDSVAFYVSGQLLTEDYYVANKLMKGFIGSTNIDTNSRLCMASTVAGHRRAFGTDTVPGTYEDIDAADTVVLVGSNLAWCHPILMNRLTAARERRGTRIVCIDPRRTATAEMADLHLALRPGGDAALFNHLLRRIDETGAADRGFLDHVEGYAATLAAARAEDAATATGLTRAELDRFARAWLRSDRTVTVFSQGVNQSAGGTDKVNAILNCHLATGRIGQRGMGPFSVTGQPNAMGGREVGGLANALAAHLDLEDPAHRRAVAQFWAAPRLAERPGLKAVEMFRAVADGRIRALWIAGTNPAVSMPEADAVRAAIAACPFTVVSDVTLRTDTAALADVVLPALAWGEKDGTVTNSDRTISRQRPALPPPGEARADWAIFAGVGRRMGWTGAFDFASPAEVFREHAALSGVAGRLGRDFDISGLCTLSDAAYAALEPVRWPVTATKSGGRFFGDGRFFTASGRARMVPVSGPATAPTATRPFRLNTGRIRDQWHTMTRTGLSPRLGEHLAEPFIDIHPADADRLGILPATLARVESDHGSALLRVRLTDRQRRGEVFAPMHWSAASASSGRVDALIPAVTDPLSGQPDSKAAAVSVSPCPVGWYGFAVTTEEPAPDCLYWARGRARGGWRVELAGDRAPADWAGWFRTLAGAPGATLSDYRDAARGLVRMALHDDGRLVAALFVSPQPVALSRSHVAALLGGDGAAPLPGVPGADRTDPGPTVCACLGIGANTITEAIRAGGLTSVEAVGVTLGAGTSCGSCRAEIAALLAVCAVPTAAE